MNNIYSFKLVSGEEIIARTKEEIINPGSINNLSIRDPMAIQITPQGMGAIPWMMTSENDKFITLFGHSLIAYSKAKPEIEKLYLQQVSGIDLSSPSPLAI